MKNNSVILAILILSASLLLSSCESTSTPPDTAVVFTDSTLFILSEGAFGSSNAQLDVYSLKNNTLSSDIVKPLGDVGNDVQFFGKRLFIVLENSNKVLSVNPDSVADRTSIPLQIGATPFKMAKVSANEVWVTEFKNNAIAVIDPNTSTLTSSIPLDASQTEISIYNGKAFILTNANNLEVLDIASKSILSNKYIGDYPAQIVIDTARNKIIIVTYGDAFVTKTLPKILWVDPATYAITDSITVSAPDFINQIIPAGNKAFVLYGDRLAILDLATHSIGGFAAKGYYKGMFDARTNQLILGAGDYTSPGSVDILDASTGNLLKTFSSGILPGHFLIYRK